MADVVERGEAIEGEKLEGSSRSRLHHRGMQTHRGVRCWRYVADEDVKAKITEALASGAAPKFEPSAKLEAHVEVVCEKVMVHSLDKKPAVGVGARSARHQANFWHFSKQTGLRIDQAHQSLVNGLNKRKELPQGDEANTPKALPGADR